LTQTVSLDPTGLGLLRSPHLLRVDLSATAGEDEPISDQTIAFTKAAKHSARLR
jgi:hypothetical protein